MLLSQPLSSAASSGVLCQSPNIQDAPCFEATCDALQGCASSVCLERCQASGERTWKQSFFLHSLDVAGLGSGPS